MHHMLGQGRLIRLSNAVTQVVESLLKNREMGLTPRSQSGLTLCESVMLLAAAVFVLTTETVVLVELVRV